MRYILLLRGINVGGKNKVSMAAFKQQLSESGFEDVVSYLNSGNLFFTTDKPVEECKHIVEVILTTYDFNMTYVLLDQEHYKRLLEDLPS